MAVHLVENTQLTSSKRVTALCKKTGRAVETQEHHRPKIAACPRSFFLKGLSRKVNIHLRCHSTCIQPSYPHIARSFLLLFLLFFPLHLRFSGMCAAPGRNQLGLLLEATGREGSSGNCRILPGCYLQSPDTAKERRHNGASYMDNLQRYKDLLLNR